MHPFIKIWICCVLLCGNLSNLNAQVQHVETRTLMGSRMVITVVTKTDSQATLAIEAAFAEINRIEQWMSSWRDSSFTSEVNRQAGKKPVAVPAEMVSLVKRCKKLSALTQGAFDITFAGMERIWQFDGRMHTLPDSAAVTASIAKVNWREVEVDDIAGTVFLTQPGMRMGFGAIGKGYAANRVRTLMQEMGVQGGIINAGGDLVCWGVDEKGKRWNVALANPQDPDTPIGWIPVEEMAVVTSGNYERYALIDGKRYAHIIDPRTGWPAQGLMSVTIVCPNAELADALATAVFVLGKKVGISFINQLEGVECMVIDEAGAWTATKGLQIH